MSLWIAWWNAILLLRPAFSRQRSFLWFATAVAGLTVRTELLGVTSIVRALQLAPRFYNQLLDNFHSNAVQLDRLAALWTQVVLHLLPAPLRINGRRVLVGDGIKVPKCGKKMPAVKLLHQQSAANTKPEYIMGHSLQAVSLLVQAAQSVFALPLAVRIHEGLVWSNRDRRTLLDKMLALLGSIAIQEPFYLVADAYYAARKIVTGLLKQGNHLVTRMKSNAVAYTPYLHSGPRKRGRPRSTAPSSSSNHCSTTRSPCKRPRAPSTASTTSRSGIGSSTYCGVRPAGWCASWRSCILPEAPACCCARTPP